MVPVSDFIRLAGMGMESSEMTLLHCTTHPYCTQFLAS